MRISASSIGASAGPGSRAASLFALGALVLLFLAAPLSAESRTVVDLDAADLDRRPNVVRLRFTRPETGRVEFVLSGARTRRSRVRIESSSGARSLENETTVYRVTARARRMNGGEPLRFTAAWYRSESRGRPVLHIPFAVVTERRTDPVQRDFELLVSIAGGKVHAELARAAPRWPARSGALPCPQISFTVPQSPAAAPPAAPAPPSAAASRFLSVSLDVDSYFYALYGADTPSVVTLALQGVQDIYSPQLDIDLRLINQTIFADNSSDPYRSLTLNFSQLLDMVQVRGNGAAASAADMHHLFTAQRGFVQAIGLAYVGTVCRYPDFHMGWSDYGTGYLRFIQTIAHEFGHSIGANHDFDQSDSIMSGTGAARVTNPYFSPFSLSEISGFTSQFGGCLLADQGQPIGDPAGNPNLPDPNESRTNIRVSLSSRISAGRATLSGRVRSLLTGTLSNRIVELRRGSDLRLLRTDRTDGSGRFSFRVKPSGSFFVVERMTQKPSVRVRF